VSNRLGESKYQNAPARLVVLIDAIDLEGDTGSPDQVSERTHRRRTEDDAAVAILIGHWQDLWALGGHETDAAGAVLLQELLALSLRELSEIAARSALIRW
jgi:hypothetical protein